MTDFTDGELTEIMEECCDSDREWVDSLDLLLLVHAAQRFGYLEGVEIHQLLPDGSREDDFLMAVDIAPDITLASRPVPWREVDPPAPATGIDAIRHLLRKLEDLADQLRSDFSRSALLRPFS